MSAAKTRTNPTLGIIACQQPRSYSVEAGTPTTTESPLRCCKTTGATSSPAASAVGQKKHLAGLPTTLDDYNTYDNEDYQAIADAIREAEDLEAASVPGKKTRLVAGEA